MSTHIPVNIPLLAGNEQKYVEQCLQSGWISSEGPFIGEFEKKFSAYIGMDHGIAVSSGSGALDIAVAALGIGPGDEVIMPTFTIISPALSVVRAGARPVLVDSDPVTWNMDVAQIEQRITERTKAILAVHLYGLPINMDPLLEMAQRHKLAVIEDAAEMHGQLYKERKCGSLGTISIFSFYANKLVTTGEGGMLLCNDPALAERCRKLRNLAFEPTGRRFVHHELGWNYRMTNLQGALGLAQLEQVEAAVLHKKQIGALYRKQLEGIEEAGYQLPLASTSYAENVYWVFGLVAPSEEEATGLTRFLAEVGISTRPFFWCMHEQPVFNNMELFRDETYPVAETLARRGFYLPSGLGNAASHPIQVADTIKTYLDGRR